MKIQIILGSTRNHRVGEKVANWVYSQVKDIPDAEVELVDLENFPLPFYDEPIIPKLIKGNYSNEIAKKWATKVAEADGYIVVTPEYNHGYPAVLKNAFDYVYDEWNNKPIGFVSYGGISGGLRAVEQLRQVVVELQMVPIRESVSFQFVSKKFDEEGHLLDLSNNDRVKALMGQLLWWVKLLMPARNSV